MSEGDTVYLAVVLLCIVSAAGLAMSETAVTRMSLPRAIALAEDGRRGAERLAKLLQRPEQVLNSVLLLVLVAHLAAATLIGILAEKHFGGVGVLLGLVVEVTVIFVLAECVPKTFAVQHTERAALIVAPFLSLLAAFPPLRVLSRMLIGISNVLIPGKGLKQGPFVSESDIRAMADAAAAGETIEVEERALIHSVFEFGDTLVREVMVPRTAMTTVAADTTVSGTLDVAREGGMSRIPVVGESVDDVVGVAYLKDLIDAPTDAPVLEHCREAMFVPQTKRAAALLREMQRTKVHLAVVVDEYGGVGGLVTMEDLIEELVGEIADEYDDEAVGETVEDPDGTLHVDGLTSVSDLADLVGEELEDGPYDTVGGYVFHLFGRIPAPGERMPVGTKELEVGFVEGNRVTRVALRSNLRSKESGSRRA